jgi:hypothetical protein
MRVIRTELYNDEVAHCAREGLRKQTLRER